MANTIGAFAKKTECYLYSLSTKGTAQLIEKRNELLESYSGPAAIGISVAAEFCFVALAVISVIEALVRVVLAALVGTTLKCLGENEWVLRVTSRGALMSAANAAVCVAALMQNLCQEEKLDYHELLPCANGCYGAAVDAVGL